MKVLFIVPYPSEGPSSRFRVEQYLDYLRAKDIGYCLRPFYNSSTYKILHKKGKFIRKVISLFRFTLKRIGDVLRARSYDIVFVHRESHPFGGAIFERLFKALAGRLVYDFDDSIFLPADTNAGGLNKVIRFFKRPSRISKIISLSDCVIAGNKFLAQYARRFNSNVTILPTCIDTDRYKPAQRPVNNQRVVIGWIGSPWTAIYLSLLDNVFAELQKMKDIEIRIIGANYGNCACPCISCRNWSLETEIKELQQFDIGIMPLSDDAWARGKCAFKIIQYMAVGIPAVASPVGMNLEVIEDGTNGFLALTDKDWIDRLSLLIKDEVLRKAMGMRGRRIVQEKYSVASNVDKFIHTLENIRA
jgi:glycosyltransferase involved in cell wall biosynthesis